MNRFIYIFDLETKMKVRIIEGLKVISKITLLSDLVCVGSELGYLELINSINHTFHLTT